MTPQASTRHEKIGSNVALNELEQLRRPRGRKAGYAKKNEPSEVFLVFKRAGKQL